jgi:hypothetical protein
MILQILGTLLTVGLFAALFSVFYCRYRRDDELPEEKNQLPVQALQDDKVP